MPLTTTESHALRLLKHLDPRAAAVAVEKTPARFKQLKHMIGNTPLLAIRFAFRGTERVIYAKAEHLNMTGSIKDRMAFHILKRAYQDGHIQPGDTIAEATSGNTGISFAAIGKALGHQVVIFMPDWMSEERVALIKSLGARIVRVRRDEGGFIGSIRMAQEMALCEPHVFLPAQFANEANVEAHEKTTGPEIWWQLYFRSDQTRRLVAGVGTGGNDNGRWKISTAQPGDQTASATASGTRLFQSGTVGQHRIQASLTNSYPQSWHGELDSVVSLQDRMQLDGSETGSWPWSGSGNFIGRQFSRRADPERHGQ